MDPIEVALRLKLEQLTKYVGQTIILNFFGLPSTSSISLNCIPSYYLSSALCLG